SAHMDRQVTDRRLDLSTSPNSPHPRPGCANERDSRQSVAVMKTRPRLAPVRQTQRAQIVHRQASTQNRPRPQPRSRPTLASNPNKQRIARTIALSWPYRPRLVSQFTSAAFKPMSSFDPAAVRKAVEEFTPRRPQKFQDLQPAKDVITELRQ